MFDISIFFVHRILQYAKRNGVSPEMLLENAGVDLPGLGRSDLKISEHHYFSIMAAAVALTGDEHLGLHMGKATEWMDLSNLGYIMANCRDLGEAVDRALGYVAFIGAPVELRMVHTPDRARLSLYLPQTATAHKRQCIDEFVATLYEIFRSITGNRFVPREVCFAYPAPADTREHRRIFSCPVCFDEPVSALVFHPRQLLTPVVPPNPKVLFMARHGRSASAETAAEQNYSEKIAKLLYAGLETGPPSIKHLAKRMGLSTRGLQMKLSEEGQTFSRIVRSVRRELAKTYLADKACSIDEITFRLGFSETSVFHRAFKNWTGLTPGEYRNMSLGKSQDEKVLGMTSTA